MNTFEIRCILQCPFYFGVKFKCKSSLPKRAQNIYAYGEVYRK